MLLIQSHAHHMFSSCATLLVREFISDKMADTRLEDKHAGTRTEYKTLRQPSVELEFRPMHPWCFREGTHPVLPPSHKDVASVYLA